MRPRVRVAVCSKVNVLKNGVQAPRSWRQPVWSWEALGQAQRHARGHSYGMFQGREAVRTSSLSQENCPNVHSFQNCTSKNNAHVRWESGKANGGRVWALTPPGLRLSYTHVRVPTAHAHADGHGFKAETEGDRSWCGRGGRGAPRTAAGASRGPAAVETAWRYLKTSKIEPACDPEIPLLGIHPKEVKAGSQRRICTALLSAASFTAARMWRRPAGARGRREKPAVVRPQEEMSVSTRKKSRHLLPREVRCAGHRRPRGVVHSQEAARGARAWASGQRGAAWGQGSAGRWQSLHLDCGDGRLTARRCRVSPNCSLETVRAVPSTRCVLPQSG